MFVWQCEEFVCGIVFGVVIGQCFIVGVEWIEEQCSYQQEVLDWCDVYVCYVIGGECIGEGVYVELVVQYGYDGLVGVVFGLGVQCIDGDVEVAGCCFIKCVDQYE